MVNHHHSTSDVKAYRVRLTISAGKLLEPAIDLEDRGSYLAALDAARVKRLAADAGEVSKYGFASYAVVCPVYSDGCNGLPF